MTQKGEWLCSCGSCQIPITDTFAWRYYVQFQRISKKHLRYSVIQNDAMGTDDPILRRLIEWRLGDPRVIRDKS